MSLLKKMMEDEGGDVTGTSSVAVSPFQLLGVGKSKKRSKGKKRTRMVRRVTENYNKSGFDDKSVYSKLKAAGELASNEDTPTARLGLEDENGDVTLIRVHRHEREEIEGRINAIRQENPEIDVAVLLVKLHDEGFDIIDAEWPNREENAEETIGMSNDSDELAPPTDEEESSLDPEGDPAGTDLAPSTAASTDDVSSLLTQVIDMLKADAEARQSEASAKAAEASAREQEISTAAAEEKIRREEQMLDMDDFYKGQKEQESEAKRLAKLAKWRHDVKTGSNKKSLEPEYSTVDVVGDDEESDDLEFTPKRKPKLSSFLQQQMEQ